MVKNKDAVGNSGQIIKTDDANLLLVQLREPRYLVSSVRQLDPAITYRRINLWENNGLFTPHRDTDKRGWRKFSLLEVVWLLMISDLKRVGMPTPVVRHVLTWLTKTPRGVPWLETLLMTTIRGMRNLLIIDVNGRPTIPLNDDAILSNIRPKEAKGPVVCCPVYKYVRRVLTLSGTKLEFTGSWQQRSISPEEMEILEIIHSEQYERIEIVKSNGKCKTVKALARKKGDFTINDLILQLQARDYQNVEISVKGGKIVTLNATDIHKL